MKPIVVIPTYNERENVAAMAAAVLENLPPEGMVLFLDDNSPDGTGEVIDGLCAEDPRISVMHRQKKEGLGRAYVAGFAQALSMGATHVIEMDCDFSHDPEDLPRLLAEDADLVIGSRYVPGGARPGWPLKPSPEIVFKAMDAAGMDRSKAPGNVVMCGDSETDMSTAKNAGICGIDSLQ